METLFDRAQLARLHAEVAGQPVDVPALLKAADAAFTEERYADTETLLRGALIAAPEQADIWHRLGQLAEVYGEVDHAAEAYRRAMELDDDERIVLDLARLLASSGVFEEAGALAAWLALQAESTSIRRAATQLAASIEKREADHAAAR